MQLTQEQADLIRAFADDEDVQVYERYSGRCMYGKQCFGLVGRNITSIAMKLACFLSQNDEAELTQSLSECTSSDSMGLESIIYFSRFSWPDESSDDSEEDEEEKDENDEEKG